MLLQEDYMKRTHLYLGGLILLMACLTGCTTAGMFHAANVTDVRLSEPNYDIVAANVTGRSQAGYIFGFSFGPASQVGTVALARVNGTAMLYQEAIMDLWNNFEVDNGPREDRKLALVNVHYDTDILNLLVYTEIRLFVHADIVEFK